MLNTSAFRSTDGGKTLINVGNGTHGDHHDLWIDPDDSKHVVLGNDGGGAISYNVDVAAARAGPTQDFPTEQFYHVITTKHVPFHVCGAQQDNSTLCVPSNTGGRGGGGGGGNPPVVPYQVGGGEPGYIAPDPKDLDVFYAGANNGSFLTRFNRRTGELQGSRRLSALLLRRELARGRRTLAVDVSDHLLARRSERPLHLLAARVEDRPTAATAGSGSAATSPSRSEDDAGFGRADHARHEQPGDLRRRCSRSRPGKTDVNVIWAGSDDGLCTSRATAARRGRTSRRRDMPDLGRVSQIDASAFDAGTAYIAVKKPLLGDFAPYIFRTHDFGQDVDEDRQRHRGQRLHARRPRGSGAEGPALRRHAARLLRLVRRRRTAGSR